MQLTPTYAGVLLSTDESAHPLRRVAEQAPKELYLTILESAATTAVISLAGQHPESLYDLASKYPLTLLIVGGAMLHGELRDIMTAQRVRVLVLEVPLETKALAELKRAATAGPACVKNGGQTCTIDKIFKI
jgi:hypothetical protein